jgi:hypothetical protein
MTKRDQVCSALGSHNACNPRNREHIAFARFALLYQLSSTRQHANATCCNRLSACYGFIANVNHDSLAGFIEVGERVLMELFIHATIIAR